MTSQTENTNDLVINPNDNDQFVDDVRMNEFAHTNEDNTIEETTTVEETACKKRANKPKTGILYTIIIILLIGGGIFYVYTFHRDLVAQYIPFLQAEELVEDKAVQSDVSTSSTTNVSKELTNNEENEIDYTSTGSASDASTNSAAVSDDEVVDAITESMLQNAAQQQSSKTETVETTISKNTATQTDFRKPLTRPAWIISVSSVNKEGIAKARVNELRAAGNTADYYWIPDYVSEGNRYFKVFVGPFATKAEAQNYLSSHELAADAYVLKVE